ncbi:hypothetical protein M514_03207 [Trichuris suis]|uniref:Uncharacterized protein n=1 Tax=Trichuris suis TaxID=68888 RepID=A0A085N983_9BILA|nr:hypothetical protein M513_03207 [Trichuris suis]KFD66029.1 hypothetical protein M514_03207 [Trichuris suis]
MLHLPMSTMCDEFFCLPKAQGKLTFMNLQERADLSSLRLQLQMRNSDPDRSVREGANSVAVLYPRQYRCSNCARVSSVSYELVEHMQYGHLLLLSYTQKN